MGKWVPASYPPTAQEQVPNIGTKAPLEPNETDFVCYGESNYFDTYNVEELLGFLEVNISSPGDAEKVVEKTSQDVKRNPELSKESEPVPEPVEAKSEESDRVFSEKAKDLQEQLTAQKHHPHTNSQADHAQGEQPSFEAFEEMLQDKLKVPENENNKTSNSSQVSNEHHKTDSYKLWKNEITLDLKTKFGSTADALISDDETTRLVTSLEDDFDEDLDAEYYAVGKEVEEKQEDFDKLPLVTFTDEEEFSDSIKTQTSQLGEVFQNKYSDYVKHDNPEEHLKTSWLAEKPEGELSKEDHENAEKHVGTESQGSAAANLEDDLFHWTPRSTVEPEYSDKREDLPIICSFFKEQQSLWRFQKYFNVHVVEDLLQKMLSKLKSAQQESLPYNVEKVLDKVFYDFESQVLSIAEKVLDPLVAVYRHLEMKENNIFEEDAVLADILDLTYFVRYKYFTAEETATLRVMAPALEEGLGGAMEEMQPPHEDNVSQENVAELSVQVPEEPTCLNQPVMRDTCPSEVSLMPHTEKDLDPGPTTTEDHPTDGVEANKQLEMVAKQPASVTPLEKTILLIHSFMFYLTKLETDFVCYGESNYFDTYNVEELLGFLEVNISSPGDAEKVVEKTSQDVKRNPELSKESEPVPEPVEAKSEESDRVFSEKAKDLQEQLTAQKHHPHTNSQADHAQGEQPSFEAFEEMLQDKLKVPENENNKTSNSSQVSNEHHKTDSYKLWKNEITLDLKTKFGSTADALISDDETTRLVTSLEDDFDEDLDAEYYAVGKEVEEKQEDFDKLPLVTFTDEEEFSDSIKTQTSQLGEVFQNKYSDYVKHDNPEEHLKTSWLAEKPEGELSKEDHENAEKHVGTESQGSAAANLEDDLFHWTPRSTVEPEYSDKREDLPIICSFFKEQQSLWRFQKYFNVHVVEDLLQKMLSKLKSAQQESLPYNVEKVLDKVFYDFESQVLSIAEKVLDPLVAVYRHLEMKENNIFEEDAVLADILDLTYFVRYKYFTAEETATLRVMAPALEEGLGGAMEEMQPLHEDDVSQENIAELSVQVPEEPTCLNQPVMRDTCPSEVSLMPHTEKDLDPGPTITEDRPTDGVEAYKQLEMVAEEPASVIPLEKTMLLIYSFMFYLTKLPGERHSPEMYYNNEQEEKYLPDGSTVYGINWFTVVGE
ncbi:hypothetical protein P7K49_036029 [Saguinus oedipus]|uniref:Uncharacterized protein n=1 Tax=Saguinus oedipus TaxID=9490 RepID=A0ABQ9TPN0_SAGOE|nr:hypothetical protein P7K49_036029 [Saguinus oedipus]